MWKEQNDTLIKIFTFANFTEAFSFMTKVAAIAEQMNHHPYWTNEWNWVEVQLTTTEEGGITQRDRDMAKAIDLL